jgi:glycogen debranching enzyme
VTITVADAGPTVLAGPGTVTLVEGLTFCISDERGDITPGPVGLVVRDTRHLSRFELRVNGEPVGRLGAGHLEPARGSFRGYVVVGGRPDPPVEVERDRRIDGHGMTEALTLRAWSAEPVDIDVRLRFASDFADIFEIRRVGVEGPPPRQAAGTVEAPGRVVIPGPGRLRTTLVLDPPPHELSGTLARWRLRVARGTATDIGLTVRAEPATETEAVAPVDQPSMHLRSGAGVASTPDGLARACRRSLADLGALTMPDALDPERCVVAAGIPWFLALFGRDSLIASHQARAFLPRLMLDTLRALAARQGVVHDAGNEEQPGKILHEVRLTERAWLGTGTTAGQRPYFGSVDSTPLFVILLAEAWRWGADAAAVRELIPAARAAMGWIRGPGDPDGDGLLEYRGRGARSLGNQGWKDSANAIQHPDGTLAEGPIAVCEAQGYAIRARRDLAAVLRDLAGGAEADELDAEADELQGEVRRRFWIEPGPGRPGHFALALDGSKRPVASVASNMGHLLWCGVPDARQAAQVAEHLRGPALASGWGVRTLAADMAGFNPNSYHVGSVWPHDSAIACEGLRRYDLDDAFLDIVEGLLHALPAFDDRLPELFGGQVRQAEDVPVPYPTACRPQAWAAGVPLDLVTQILGLRPDVPVGRVSLDPVLPAGVERLELRGVDLGRGPLSLRVDAEGVHVLEAPPGCLVELRGPPRGPRAHSSRDQPSPVPRQRSQVSGT